MSRFLHWSLLLGCGALAALFARPAWDAVSVCELPNDCRTRASWLEALLGGEDASTERLGALEEDDAGAPASTDELVAGRS